MGDNNLNLEILKDRIDLTCKAKLFIEPLAPLSLVSSLPGAYYRSQREPTVFMILGILENLLGWHYTESERNPIINDLKKYHQKKYKNKLNFDKTPVGYKPLLQNHLKIEQLLYKPYIESFEDYWTQHLKDVDERHAKGNRNYDSKIDFEVNKIYESESKEREKLWRNLFENQTDFFPIYYQSPTKREFIVVQGKYGFIISLTYGLYNLLKASLDQLDSPLYLGTSEGWINLELESL